MNKKLALSGVFLILFLLVLVSVISGIARPIDSSINLSFSGFENSFLTGISSLIDLIFDTYVMIGVSIIVAILLFISRRRKSAWIFGLIMIAEGLIIYILKNLVSRVRPLGLIEASSYSFPSGHATTAVVFFGLLIYLLISRIKNNNLKVFLNWVCVLVILIIAFSRIYLRVHWFSDVVSGIFLGLGILFLGLGIVNKINKN